MYASSLAKFALNFPLHGLDAPKEVLGEASPGHNVHA